MISLTCCACLISVLIFLTSVLFNLRLLYNSFKISSFFNADNVVFSSLIYLNYEGIVPENRKYIRLEEAGIKYLEKYSYFEISKLGIAQKVSYQLLKQVLKNTKKKIILMMQLSLWRQFIIWI